MPNTKSQLEIDLAAAKKRIPAAKYNKLLGHLILQDVYLKQAKTVLFSRNVSSGASLSFNESAKIVKRGADSALIEVSYLVKAAAGKRRVFEVAAKYYVEFRYDAELTEDFFVLYNTYSLPFQTFPYLRELVNTSVSRMGLPSLILPLRKYLTGGSQ